MAAPTAVPTVEDDLFLTQQAVAAARDGSPGKTVLVFWQAVQVRDMRRAFDLLTPAYRAGAAENLPHFAEFLAAELAHWLVRPRIVSTTRDGDTAHVVVDYATPSGPVRESFTLRRLDGRWLIAYNFYLSTRLQGK